MSIKNFKKKKKTQSNVKGIVVLLLALSIISCVFVFNYTSKNIQEHTDSNLCRSDYLPSITAILIDNTDSYTPIQQEVLKNYFTELTQKIPKGGLVTLYTVGASDQAILEPKLEVCNPGSLDDVENKLTKRASQIKKNYTTLFKDGIEKEIMNASLNSGAASSPIMESIQAIDAKVFRAPGRKDVRKTIIIVSDMLQHVRNFSLLKSVPKFSDYKKTSYWQSINANLKDVDVKILLIRRPAYASVQKRALQEFWYNYFLAQGAELSEFDPI